MDADEFAEWRIYLAENPPLDFWEAWKMVGRICASMYGAFAGKSREPERFMPKKIAKPPAGKS